MPLPFYALHDISFDPPFRVGHRRAPELSTSHPVCHLDSYLGVPSPVILHDLSATHHPIPFDDREQLRFRYLVQAGGLVDGDGREAHQDVPFVTAQLSRRSTG